MAKKRHNFLSVTSLLIFLTVALTLIGLFFVFEASVSESFRLHGHAYHFLKQHSVWVIVGFFAMFVASFLRVRYWFGYSLIFCSSKVKGSPE